MILLYKFGSRPQKLPKITQKQGDGMVPGESSCPGGSEYVCQIGVAGVQAELWEAEVAPRLKKIANITVL